MSVNAVAPSVDLPRKTMSWSRQMLRRVLAATVSRRRFLVSGPADSGVACLTFDDGPDPLTTPLVLDVLAEHRVPATFFVVGRQVADNPELLRRIASEGHLIGHHSWSHSEPSSTSCRALMTEVDQTRSLLTKLGVANSQWFRPPKGKLTASKMIGLWCKQQVVVLWSHDVRDYQAEDVHALGERFSRSPIASGDIVLLHDNQQQTAQVLSSVISETQQRGVRFGTPLDWFSCQAPASLAHVAGNK